MLEQNHDITFAEQDFESVQHMLLSLLEIQVPTVGPAEIENSIREKLNLIYLVSQTLIGWEREREPVGPKNYAMPQIPC